MIIRAICITAAIVLVFGIVIFVGLNGGFTPDPDKFDDDIDLGNL